MYHATVNGRKKLDIEWDQAGNTGSLNGVSFTADMSQEDKDKSHWLHNNKSYNVEIVECDHETKEVQVKVNGNPYTVQLKDRFDDLLKSLGMENSGGKKMKDLKAPMPGMVLQVMVNEGENVEKDTPLIILEAMKMENVIKSPAAGTVKKINAIKGTAVEKNSVLLEFQ